MVNGFDFIYTLTQNIYMYKNAIFLLPQTHASAWPFLKPVDKAEAPDYYDHIRFPMGKLANFITLALSYHSSAC